MGVSGKIFQMLNHIRLYTSLARSIGIQRLFLCLCGKFHVPIVLPLNREKGERKRERGGRGGKRERERERERQRERGGGGREDVSKPVLLPYDPVNSPLPSLPVETQRRPRWLDKQTCTVAISCTQSSNHVTSTRMSCALVYLCLDHPGALGPHQLDGLLDINLIIPSWQWWSHK